MEVTVIQKTKNYTVSGTQNIKRFEVNATQSTKRFEVNVAELGKRGFDGLSVYQIAVRNGVFAGTEAEFAAAILPNFSVLGNYERDWANDFLIVLNT
jgi:hypothetical protein